MKRIFLIAFVFASMLSLTSCSKMAIDENYLEKNNLLYTNVEQEFKETKQKLAVSLTTQDNFQVVSSAGGLESVYVEWKNITNVQKYNVYYRENSTATWKSVDGMLVRTYQTYSRVDILGLAAGTTYQVRIVCVSNGQEIAKEATVTNLVVKNHVREGFGFVNGTSSGAYNDNGTLKSNAVVLYITNDNKNTVSMNVTGANSNPCVGLQTILNAFTKKQDTRPLNVRMIGNVTDFSTMEGGDILIGGQNITFEGIGKDATANGWGIRVKNASNIEIRNIGFMLTDASEGDDIGLQQGNDHIWVHNCDLFYGKAGSDADQAKGDGALDTKKSMYVTHSYNHFWDTGKSNLVGNGENITTQNYITFHHNWYDHSDSRHPRIRVATVHVYNNLFDGVSKYGVGATTGSSVFVESNVFKNTKNPILSSLQGTDIANGSSNATFSGEAGGMIKAYNNLSSGTTTAIISHLNSSTSFDAYVSQSRNEQVPSSYKTLSGGTTYNNFDTASSMYSYTPTSVSSVESNVKAYAGRIQGGDFNYVFTDADNTKSDVNTGLMNALLAYSDSILAIGENQTSTTPTEPENPQQGSSTHNFTTQGKTSSFFTITGNMNSSSFNFTFDGLTLTKALKIESSTNISFKTTSSMQLTLVLTDATKRIYIDGVSYTSASNLVRVTLAAGNHTITKQDTTNLMYIKLV